MQSLARSFVAYFVLVASAALGVVFSVPLVLSFRLRQWFFARIYRVVQAIFDECWNPMRKDVMAYLDNMQSHDEELREKGLLRVLELGAAYGGNFPFIRRRIEYWNVDPNKDFQAAFRHQLKKYPKVQLKRHIIGYGEDMHELPDEYFDAVVMTFVLCSAKDGAKVLQEVKRVLAKGGRLVFVEHVAHPKGSPARLLQHLSTFFSAALVGGGCHQNRESWLVLEAARFSKLEMKEANVDLPYFFSRNFCGYAEK
ncbi:thiol S-methyltransferase TMT1B-like [Haemaphysalis longicornis]